MITKISKSGFTLMELLVGVALIAMVMAMVLNSSLNIIKFAQIINYKVSLQNDMSDMVSQLDSEMIGKRIDYQSHWYAFIDYQLNNGSNNTGLNNTKDCDNNANIVRDSQFCSVLPGSSATSCTTTYSYVAQFVSPNTNNLDCQEDTAFDDDLAYGEPISSTKVPIDFNSPFSTTPTLFLINDNGDEITVIKQDASLSGGATDKALFITHLYYGDIDGSLTWYYFRSDTGVQIALSTSNTFSTATNIPWRQISSTRISVDIFSIDVFPSVDPSLAISSTSTTIQKQPSVILHISTSLSETEQAKATGRGATVSPLYYQYSWTQIATNAVPQKYPVMPFK